MRYGDLRVKKPVLTQVEIPAEVQKLGQSYVEAWVSGHKEGRTMGIRQTEHHYEVRLTNLVRLARVASEWLMLSGTEAAAEKARELSREIDDFEARPDLA